MLDASAKAELDNSSVACFARPNAFHPQSVCASSRFKREIPQQMMEL